MNGLKNIHLKKLIKMIELLNNNCFQKNNGNL